MDWRDNIVIDAGRQGGQPCLRGTRVPVCVILDNLAAGEAEATILAEYPSLTENHIHAALAFRADSELYAGIRHSTEAQPNDCRV